MPAFREEKSQITILDRLPRAGYGGCFGKESRTTGERVWALLSEQINNQKDRDTVHNRLQNTDYGLLQVGQAVNVNYGRRLMSAHVVRKVPCSHNVELCLQDGVRVVVDQHNVQIPQNAEGYNNTVIKTNGSASLDSFKRTAPLVINIPNDTDLESQSSDDAEEQMAAAVLTSLSLSPVLKNIQLERDEIFEDVMNIECVSDEALSPTTLSDQEINRKPKLRRRKSTSKTLFQCTWPRCGKMLTNSHAIVRHIRAWHLGPKANKGEGGYSDGEEEFYFIEIERNGDDVNDHSSEEAISPPLTRTTSRRCRSFSDPSVPTQPPVRSSAQLHVDDNFIWPLRQAGGRGKAKRPLHQTVHTNTRKARGDGKKCRKVFGMENKQLWCTQCRWKKACVKFID